jgi:hypothetical protein
LQFSAQKQFSSILYLSNFILSNKAISEFRGSKLEGKKIEDESKYKIDRISENIL